MARFAHFFSLSRSGRGSDTLSGTWSALVCRAVKLEMCHQSSVLWAGRTGERATLQTGLLLQVWDQRPYPHRGPSHSSSPLCSLMTLSPDTPSWVLLNSIPRFKTDPTSYLQPLWPSFLKLWRYVCSKIPNIDNPLLQNTYFVLNKWNFCSLVYFSAFKR